MISALTMALALSLQASAEDTTRLDLVLAEDTVLVGQPFRVRLEVSGVQRRHVVFPELPDTGAIAALGPAEETGRPGDRLRSAEYQLVAWESGELRLPGAVVRVESDGGVRRLRVPDRTIYVRSVLPADADPETLAWQPARDVMGPNWSLAQKVAAALVALALLIAAVVVVRRLRRSEPPLRPVPVGSPRDRALESLDALAASELLEIGEMKAFYSELSRIVRTFLAESDPLWGLDLTTAELIGAVARDGVGEYDLSVIADLLVEADLVKFAGRRPAPRLASDALERSRGWVAGFHRRPAPAVEPEVETDPGAPDEVAERTEVDAGAGAETTAPTDGGDVPDAAESSDERDEGGGA